MELRRVTEWGTNLYMHMPLCADANIDSAVDGRGSDSSISRMPLGIYKQTSPTISVVKNVDKQR